MVTLHYSKQEIIDELLETNIIKYGDFVLKSGERSDIYADIKMLISYPKLVTKIISVITDKLTAIIDIETNKNDYVICGVPYGGIYFASVLSLFTGIPMILLRNDIKSHGTKKRVEGNYRGKKVILIEDVITTGGSIIESILLLKAEGLEVDSVLVILDREKNGFKNVQTKFKEIGMDRLNSCLTISDLVSGNQITRH